MKSYKNQRGSVGGGNEGAPFTRILLVSYKIGLVFQNIIIAMKEPATRGYIFFKY